MKRDSYGYIGSWDSLDHFFFESDMTKHLYNQVEIPSFITAMEQEKILKTLGNQQYRFKLWIDKVQGPFNKTIYLELEFLDNLTKMEYELVK